MTLAKALNCAEKEADSCDRCSSCHRIEERVHPDIYWVQPDRKSGKSPSSKSGISSARFICARPKRE